METVKSLLSCEVTFISSEDFKVLKKPKENNVKRIITEPDLFTSSSDDSYSSKINNLLQIYQAHKRRYINDYKTNLFYTIL